MALRGTPPCTANVKREYKRGEKKREENGGREKREMTKTEEGEEEKETH